MKQQLNTLKNAIDVYRILPKELRENIQAEKRRGTPSSTYPGNEMERMGSFMANMMDLFMEEIDTVKQDLYIDFAQTQKIIANDLGHLKEDHRDLNQRFDMLEKYKDVKDR